EVVARGVVPGLAGDEHSLGHRREAQVAEHLGELTRTELARAARAVAQRGEPNRSLHAFEDRRSPGNRSPGAAVPLRALPTRGELRALAGLGLVPALGELLEELRVERREVIGLPTRDEAVVHDDLAIHPVGAGVAEVRLQRRPRRDGASLHGL